MTENKTSKKSDPQKIEPQAESKEPTFVPSEFSSEPILEKPPAQSVETETSEDLDSEATEEWKDPQLLVSELEANVADLNDKLLRALAETENVRRRAQRDYRGGDLRLLRGPVPAGGDGGGPALGGAGGQG